MVEFFTADELDALADFYGSQLGRSIIKKFPKYMAAVMPTMNAHVVQASEKVLEEIKRSKKWPIQRREYDAFHGVRPISCREKSRARPETSLIRQGVSPYLDFP